MVTTGPVEFKLKDKESIIRYRGVFDFESIYEGVAEWFKRQRFQFHDLSYKHKVPSPFGAEQEFTWVGTINVSEFLQFRIDIDTHIWDMNDVEVIKEGKKKILTSGRLEIKMVGRMIFDWQRKFDKSRISMIIRDLWLKWMWRREAESIWHDTLYYRMWDLHAQIKKMLGMQTAHHQYRGYLGENR